MTDKKIPKRILKELEKLPWNNISKAENILDAESRKYLREHKVLDWIRSNVTLKRIEKAEKTLKEYDVDEQVMESVYRAHKGSIKIEYSQARGEIYLKRILYVLFGEVAKRKDIKKVIETHFDKDNYFGRYAHKFLDIKIINEKKKTSWIDVEPYIYLVLGAELFFKYTLRALLNVCKKALTDPEYDYVVMDWDEGIVEYLVYELLPFEDANTGKIRRKSKEESEKASKQS